MKKALISGVCGQDGSYMAELLLAKGYEVQGIVSEKNKNFSNIEKIKDQITIHEVNLNKSDKLCEIIHKIMPDELYNFAAQSSSVLSWDKISYTYDTNFQAVKNIAEFVRKSGSKIKLFNANSSEIFGLDPIDTPQNENTLICPNSPYAVAKAMAYYMLRQYRITYDEFFVSGIFYNHESERRGNSFLSKKITDVISDIALDIDRILEIGDLDTSRDWGYAPDYMEAVWRIMQLDSADDYIISTGVLHTVKEFVETAFVVIGKKILWREQNGEIIGLDSLTNKVLVKTNRNFSRNNDYTHTVGDNAKIKGLTGWKPETSFEDMIKIMVETSIVKKTKE